MEKIYYQTLKETLFHEELENGLEVYLLPKIGFEKTYGLFSTRFGSIDTTFVPLGQKEMIKVEDGIAHFLEHKMFDMENGDAADEFAKLGASSNAFTSSSRTAYLFSTTTNENDCVELLLDFVQSLNITDESVEKEKGNFFSKKFPFPPCSPSFKKRYFLTEQRRAYLVQWERCAFLLQLCCIQERNGKKSSWLCEKLRAMNRCFKIIWYG